MALSAEIPEILLPSRKIPAGIMEPKREIFSVKAHDLHASAETIDVLSKFSASSIHAPCSATPCSCIGATSSPPNNKNRKNPARTVFSTVACSGRVSAIVATSPIRHAMRSFSSAGLSGSKSLNDRPCGRCGTGAPLLVPFVVMVPPVPAAMAAPAVLVDGLDAPPVLRSSSPSALYPSPVSLAVGRSCAMATCGALVR